MDNHAQIRSNLAELKQKLNSHVCKVAYMGSSVTVQKEGYRIFLQQFLREYFHQEHLEICAAIGGVGAITGVFTMDEDVVNYAPELCFVEYMVSDRIEDNTPQSEIGKVIEGIVRKLNKIDCQIVFLYRYLDRKLINHRYQYALDEYEKIAKHYNITSIDFGGYIQECIEQQKYTHESLFKDHTHTTETGSKVAAKYIASVLKNVFESNSNLPSKSKSIQPVYPENYSDTAIAYINPNFLANRSNYTQGLCADKVKNHQSKSKDYQYFEIASDNSFQFQIKGELIGLMVIIGKDSGIIELSAANQSEKIMLWDKWCHYDRFTTIILSQKYPQPTKIKIKITDDPIDYSSCRREIANPEQIIKKLKLVGIMTRADTKVMTTDAAKTLTIPELIELAKRYESAENYDKALSSYLDAVKIAPNKAPCMALARYIIRRKKKQEIELENILASYSSPIFQTNLAHAFYQLAEYDRATVCFRQAISHNSRLAEDILPIMQAAQLKQNKQDEATRLYQEWIENYYIINHQHKIIYCPIPKNACTLFKEIMVKNSEHQASFQASGLDVHRYIRRNNVQLGDFAYLSNPEYLKIAIVRNPLDRLVSGYLNKFVRPKKITTIVRNIIKDVYRLDKLKPDYQKSITFSDFINYLVRTEDHFLNEHWRSQYSFLGKDLVEFDLYNSLENVSNIIQKLELKIGVEISHKKTKNKTNYSENLDRENWHTIYPAELRKLKQLPTADSWYTAKLITLVKDRYALDFEIYEGLQSININSLTTNKLS